MSRPTRVVYRALIGGYEQLRDETVARDSDASFICFTDDPTLTSNTWQIELVEPRMPSDLTRSSRALKILGHPLLDDFDETMWLDNTVALRTPPDELFDVWLDEADVAAPLHSYRDSVLAEAEAVIDGGLDGFARVYEQMHHYLASGHDVVNENPHWTGMLARRRTVQSDAAMVAWWEDVLRYSRRDQLSFVRAMRSRDVKLHSVPIGTMSSSWHEWPRAEGRISGRSGSGLREALRPPAGRIGELQQSLDAATQTLAVTVAHREGVIVELESALRAAEERATASEIDLDGTRHECNLLRSRLEACDAERDSLRRVVTRKSRKLRKTRQEVARLRGELARRSEWRRRLGLGSTRRGPG